MSEDEIYEFDYYGNLIKYTVDFDCDGITVTIVSCEVEPEDEAEMRDIKFHCGSDYDDKSWDHFKKTGYHL